MRRTVYGSADMCTVYVAVSLFILWYLPSSFVVFWGWSMRRNLRGRLASVGLVQARPNYHILYTYTCACMCVVCVQ